MRLPTGCVSPPSRTGAPRSPCRALSRDIQPSTSATPGPAMHHRLEVLTTESHNRPLLQILEHPEPQSPRRHLNHARRHTPDLTRNITGTPERPLFVLSHPQPQLSVRRPGYSASMGHLPNSRSIAVNCLLLGTKAVHQVTGLPVELSGRTTCVDPRQVRLRSGRPT